MTLALPLLLLAAACGGGDDAGGGGGEETAAPETAGEPGCDETVPGSQIDYGVFAPTARLDPTLTTAAITGGTEVANIYDVLMTYDWQTDRYEPKLAESLEPNEDHTVWTLTLREGITFSDGTKLDAQLVADNLDRYFQPGVASAAGGYLTSITEKKVVDERTLELTLDSAWAELPHVFADVPGMIVNVGAVGDDPAAFAAEPPEAAGVGPYVVERNVPGEELVLTAREDYWDGPVCVETLRFVYVPGGSATYEAFQAGQLDAGFLRDAPTIERARDAGEESFFVQQDAGTLIMLNHREGRAGSDPRVREAMALAIDAETVSERAYEGALVVSKSLATEGSRFYSEEIEEFPTDADRARDLLEEAKADGFDGTIELLCGNALPASEVALTVEGLLEAVGFEVEVELTPTQDQIGKVFQNDFEAACWGWSFDASTAHVSLIRNLHSESRSNRTGYANPDMDAALDALRAAADEDALTSAFAEINRIFLDDAVSPVFGATPQGLFWSPEVKGVTPIAASMFMFDKAYIDD